MDNKNHNEEQPKAIETVESTPQEIKDRISSLSDKYKKEFEEIASYEQGLILEMADMAQGNIQLNARTGMKWNRLTPQQRSDEINKLANESFTYHIAYLKRAVKAKSVDLIEIQNILMLPTLEEDDRLEAEKLQQTLLADRAKKNEERFAFEQNKENELKRLRKKYIEDFEHQDTIAKDPIDFAVKTVLAVAGDATKEELLKKYREDKNKIQDFKTKVHIEVLIRTEIFQFTERMKSIKDTYKKIEQDIANVKEEFEQGKQKFEVFFTENNSATELPLDQLLSKGSEFFSSIGNQLFSDSKKRELVVAKETLNKFVVQNVDSISIMSPGKVLELPLANELQENSKKLQTQHQQLKETLAQLEKDRNEFFVQYQEKYKAWRFELLKQDAEHDYDQSLIYKEGLLHVAEKNLVSISDELNKAMQDEKEEQEEHQKLVKQLKDDIETTKPDIEKNLHGINLWIKKIVKKEEVQEADKLLKSLESRYKSLQNPGSRDWSSVYRALMDRLKEIIKGPIVGSDFLPENTKLVIRESVQTMHQEFSVSSDSIKKVEALKVVKEQVRVDYLVLEKKLEAENHSKHYSRYEYLKYAIPFSTLDTLRIRINDLLK